MTVDANRLVGSAEILPVMKKLYGMGTWRGALYYIKREGIPIHRTADNPKEGKPFIYITELIQHELKKGRHISVDGVTIQ
ncbi:MAG: hypothetical protein CVU62_13235 [Deltaproteobacteria bacterium HGW-Deltaproteobacteria-2]|jgi:hypothetical protein|nr:MAG: hypothetical protein CVU62_13235 [Deltaproteobacteria bacterium HGW-Deltaproteobacteria-2]